MIVPFMHETTAAISSPTSVLTSESHAGAEREADAVAATIMRMPGASVQRKCAHCEEEQVQRKPMLSFIQQKASGSQPLIQRTRTDLFAGTHRVSDAEHNAVETILNRGSSSAVNPASPDCTNGSYETRIRGIMVPFIQQNAADFRSHPTVTFGIPAMQSMADIAQQEVENYFGAYTSVATHTGGRYSSAFSVRRDLRDQSRTRQWRTRDGRRGWISSLMSSEAQAELEASHCNDATNTAIANRIADDPALRQDIDDMVNGWPAEATGHIHLQTHVDNPDRAYRWDVFTTIIHEFLHILTHPNYMTATELMGGERGHILREGMTDVFRRELWDGPGNLLSRVQQPAFNSRRAVIEGSVLPPDPAAIQYHSDYDQRQDAEEIVNAVGRPNAKAAYFLGHIELLGIGDGTASTDPLRSVGMYHNTADDNDNVVDVQRGETGAALLSRTGGAEIRDMANNPLSPAAALPRQVRVPGVTRVTVLRHDNMWVIARQHGITMPALLRANQLTNPNLIFPGQSIIIPVH